MRTRRVLLAGFVAHMRVTRLPKYVMFGELVGGGTFHDLIYYCRESEGPTTA